jgi:hypothetical protein
MIRIGTTDPTEWAVAQKSDKIWKAILQPLNNYFQYGPTAQYTSLGLTYTVDLSPLLPGLTDKEKIAISGLPKDYFPWYSTKGNPKQPLHCTSGYIPYLTYGIEPTEDGQNIKMLTTAYPGYRYNYYFERSYYK